MPELPEVETTRRGIEPHVVGQRIERIILRHDRLRWPISSEVRELESHRIVDLSRRGKYLLMHLDRGHLIWRLGMSGSLRILPVGSPAEKHEHVEMQFANAQARKSRDPRRFGALLFTEEDPLQHKLIQSLGPEPLSDEFSTDYLYARCRKRQASIKTILMNSQVVVGVGNIYASEALFLAGIRPTRAGGRISKTRIGKLVDAVKLTLQKAIQAGGTTLQDFTQADGNPGYFRHELQVYGNRDSCPHCGEPIRQIVLGQRASYYCPQCQS